MRLTWILTAAAWLVLFSANARAIDCEEITAAIEAYEKGQVERAIQVLQCRIERDSRDYLARKILSDIYWWSDDLERSIEVAKSIDALPDTAARNPIRAQLRKRISPVRLRAQAESVSGSNQSVVDGSAGISYRYRGKNHASATLARSSILLRTAASLPATRLSDTQLQLTHAGPVGRFSYLDLTGTYSPTNQFLPRTSLSVTPHYVFSDGSDVWLGARWREFDTRTAIDISAGWILPVSKSVYVDSSATLTVSDGVLPQLGSTLTWASQSGWELTGGVVGGRTIETPSIDANFWETQLRIAKPLWVAWIARAGFHFHRSASRHEQRLTLGFDWLF